jgi:hypothetical protein
MTSGGGLGLRLPETRAIDKAYCKKLAAKRLKREELATKQRAIEERASFLERYNQIHHEANHDGDEVYP